MNLHNLVAQMRRHADEKPFRPPLGNIMDYRRDLRIDGYNIKITLTRTMVGRWQFYQLSLGNDEADPLLLPRELVQKLKAAFVPKSVPMASALGNTLQFIEAANAESEPAVRQISEVSLRATRGRR